MPTLFGSQIFLLLFGFANIALHSFVLPLSCRGSFVGSLLGLQTLGSLLAGVVLGGFGSTLEEKACTNRNASFYLFATVVAAHIDLSVLLKRSKSKHKNV
jgi:hypothetical protein